MNMVTFRRAAKLLLPARIYQAIKGLRHQLEQPSRYLVWRVLASVPLAPLRRYQYPSLLSIFLTTRCNLRCFICRREGFKGKDLEFENLYKLEKAIKYARTIDLTGWGESLLYPRFEDVLHYIYQLNPRENLIQITTNGTKLSERTADLLSGHLKLLIISLNAATAETYNRDMKYGDFDQTLASIRAFLARLAEQDRRKVQLHFVAHTENFLEIPQLVVLASDLGISRVSVGNYLVGIAEHSQYSLLNVKEEYNVLLDQAQSLGAELGVEVHGRRFFSEAGRSVKACMSPFQECYIGVDGDVGPCCFCGDYRIGNAYESSFEDVWFGEAYQKLRRTRYLAACQSCTPYLSFDDHRAHFTAYLKSTNEF